MVASGPRRWYSNDTTTRWSRGTSSSADVLACLLIVWTKRGCLVPRELESLEFGGQRASDWWSLRGPHLYCNHSPLFYVLLPYHQEKQSWIHHYWYQHHRCVPPPRRYGRPVCILHPLVHYVIGLVSTPNDDITGNPSTKLATGEHRKTVFQA